MVMPCGAEVSQFDKDNRWVRLTTELTGRYRSDQGEREKDGRAFVEEINPKR